MYLVISGGHPKAAPSEIRPQYLEANMCELVALRHRVLGYPIRTPLHHHEMVGSIPTVYYIYTVYTYTVYTCTYSAHTELFLLTLST